MPHYSELILLVDDVLGPASSQQSHWQYRCRTQPRVMERVLAEVKMLKQDRASPKARLRLLRACGENSVGGSGKA